MKTCIALFRGINVGGSNILPMKELVSLFQNLGFRNVRTYIQSGNVIFQSDENNIPQLKARICEEINRKDNERFGLVRDLFFLHAPDGIGRSKLAANAEKLLGVSMTDRNWRTVSQVAEMARGIADEALRTRLSVKRQGRGTG
jgi:uncharacterized protein (DUF1697 family)